VLIVTAFGFSGLNKFGQAFFFTAEAQGRKEGAKELFFLCIGNVIFGNSMSKINTKVQHGDNPFLTDKADDLWRQLDKGGKRVSKEELLERIRALKEKRGQ
jgi:hypothetical protein